MWHLAIGFGDMAIGPPAEESAKLKLGESAKTPPTLSVHEQPTRQNKIERKK
jgi:hypothetical protein